MAKRKLDLEYARPKVRELFERAAAQRERPIIKAKKEEPRAMRMAMTYFGTVQSQSEIGASEKPKISGERVRQQITKAVRLVWENSSPELRRSIPYKKISLRKAWAPELGLRLSQGHHGPMREVALAVKKFQRNEEKLRQEIAKIIPPSHNLGRIREVLAKQGVEVPYFRTPARKNRDLKISLEKARSDEEIRALLAGVNESFVQRCRNENWRIVLPIRKVAAGFHFAPPETHLFVESLEKRGVPVARIDQRVRIDGKEHDRCYYFIVGQHRRRARKIWASDPSLEQFRRPAVKQIAGPKDGPLPTSTELYFSGKFQRPGKLLMELGIVFGGRGKGRVTLSTFGIRQSPVAVFRFGDDHYYRLKDEAKMRKFLRESVKDSKDNLDS